MKVKLLENYGKLPPPMYLSEGASGIDLRSAIIDPNTGNEVIVWPGPGLPVMIPTGLSVAIPPGFEGQVRPRSGMALKGLTVANSPGTIDCDYRGEIKVIVKNVGKDAIHITRGLRIAQLCIVPVVQADIEIVDELDETERGEGGFGSTGDGGGDGE